VDSTPSGAPNRQPGAANGDLPSGEARDDRVLHRPRHRLRPSFADALAAGGGLIVWLGALLLGLDVTANTGDGWTGALLFVALAVLAIIALIVTPASLHPGCMSMLVLSVPTIYGFMIFPAADSFADVRAFLALTLVTLAVLFLVSNSRGRPVLIGLVAAILYFWMAAEVTDTDAYFTAPVRDRPATTAADRFDGVRGDSAADDMPAAPAAFGGQDITLDDLDPSAPLYPLAESCEAGDDLACDELWNQSELGSDFEEFAESCGGDPDRSYPCAATTDTTEGFDFDGDMNDENLGELDVTPLNPLEETPLESEQGRALEIGLVSVAFGAVYLGAVWLLDRRALPALATAVTLPAVTALVIAAVALGEESESAVVGGLLTLVVGIAIGVVGFFGRDRRFMAWAGGMIASVGVLIVAVDVAPEPSPSGDDPDLIGAGFVVLAFGLVVLVLGWLVHRLLERRGVEARPPLPPSRTGEPPDEPASPAAT
jgi:hypothetical protein